MERKGTYRGSSEAQRRAVRKYNAEKVDMLTLRMPKGDKERYKAIAAAAGLSLNRFVIEALELAAQGLPASISGGMG